MIEAIIKTSSLSVEQIDGVFDGDLLKGSLKRSGSFVIIAKALRIGEIFASTT